MRAASADALVPVAPELIKMGHAPKIRDQLWSLLEKVDELSPATASVLQLLSHLYAQPGNCQISDALSELVPSLWPFLVHTLRIVRSSSMLCMERLLAASKQQGASSWLGPVLHGMLQFTFQQLLVEEDEGIQATAMRVWSLLLECAEPAALVAILSGAPLHVAATPAAVAGAAGAKRNVVHNWLALASTPSGMVLDTSCMVAALQASLGSPVELVPVSSLSSHSGMHTGSTSAGGAAKRARKGAAAAAPQHERAPNKMLKFVVGAQGDGSAVRMRMLTARALGQLCNTVAGQDSGLLLSELMASLTCSSATARSVSALVLWHWMKEAPAKAGQPGDCRSTEVLSQLFMLLSCSSCWQPSVPTSAEPYSEAVPYYEHMRRELLALITACMNAGWLLHTPGGMPVDSMATEHVVAMLTTVPQTPEGSLVCEPFLCVCPGFPQWSTARHRNRKCCLRTSGADASASLAVRHCCKCCHLACERHMSARVSCAWLLSCTAPCMLARPLALACLVTHHLTSWSHFVSHTASHCCMHAGAGSSGTGARGDDQPADLRAVPAPLHPGMLCGCSRAQRPATTQDEPDHPAPHGCCEEGTKPTATGTCLWPKWRVLACTIIRFSLTAGRSQVNVGCFLSQFLRSQFSSLTV